MPVIEHENQKTIDDFYAINRNLEQVARQLYDYWFVQFNFPDENGKPYKSSGGEMGWNESLKRNIPKGWESKTINDITTSSRGVTYDKSDLTTKNDTSVLVLRGNNIDDDRLVYDGNVAYIPKSLVSLEQRIRRNDIIMTMSSGSKEHIGKCAYFKSDSVHTYGAFLTKFTPQKGLENLLYLFFVSPFYKAKIKSICNGTGINNLTNATFDQIFITVPDEKTIEHFQRISIPLFDEIGKNENGILKLQQLRDELLPMLLNGQVNCDLFYIGGIMFHQII